MKHTLHIIYINEKNVTKKSRELKKEMFVLLLRRMSFQKILMVQLRCMKEPKRLSLAG